MTSTSTDFLCPECSENIDEKARCNLKCQDRFHAQCVGITDAEEPEAINAVTYTSTCCKCGHGGDRDELNKACLKKSFDDFSKTIGEHFEAQRRFIDEHLTKMMAICENRINELIFDIRSGSGRAYNAARAEVSSNQNVVSKVDSNIGSTLEVLEKRNKALLRRLNRSNIVINGLPQRLPDLIGVVIKIANICNVQITQRDVYHCCYFANRKSVLVKLNSVQTRDLIMTNYYRAQPIFLDDIFGAVHSRIYLNDHLTPDAYKLMCMCRKLRNSKVIRKFKLINGDVPKAVVIFGDGVTKSLVLEDFQRLMDDLAHNRLRGVN